MISHRRHFGRRSFLRRSRILFVLTAYIGTVFGFPIYSGPTAQPCQGHSCSCETERIRLGTCCCSKPAAAASGCCGSDAHVHVDESQCGSCCTSPAPTAPSDDRRNEPASSWRWVSSISVMRCQGISTIWLTTSAVLPPPAVAQWSPVFNCIDWLKSSHLISCFQSFAPPDPPPRSVV